MFGRMIFAFRNMQKNASNCDMKYEYHNGKKFIISRKLFENDQNSQFKNKTTEPNSTWTSKLSAYHKLLDINNDGVVSVEDLKELTKRFSKINGMTDKQSSVFGKVIENLWYKHWGCIDPFDYVTIEKYLNYIKYVQQNDENLKNEVVQLLPYLFKAVDKDQSGHITQEEYNKFIECIGTSKKNDLIRYLGIINDKDDTINVNEVTFIVRKHLFFSEKETIQ